MSLFDLDQLPNALLGEVVSRTGAWPSHDGAEIISPLLVSRAWRDLLREPVNLARALIIAHGPQEALLRAAGCSIPAIDPKPLVHAIL